MAPVNNHLPSLLPITSLTVTTHSTRSNPSLHVIWGIEVERGVRRNENGEEVGKDSGESRKETVWRRYREFTQLQSLLAKLPTPSPNLDLPSLPAPPGPLSPSLLSHVFSTNAFLNDDFLEERKQGLQEFLNGLLKTEKAQVDGEEEEVGWKHHALVRNFFSGLQPHTVTLPAIHHSSIVSAKSGVEAADAKVDAGKGLICAYYPDWVDLDPSDVNFKKLNVVVHSFAIPAADGSLSFSEDRLKSVVSAAHDNGAKAILSIGGWSGSKNYSDAVKSSNRDKFVNAVKGAVNDYSLDGVDFDWEYPNSAGEGSNNHSADDADNFLATLKGVRSAIGNDAFISIAVPTGSLWEGTSDMSGFASVISYLMLMNYDVNGASSNPGPNAPLSNACNNSKQPDANAKGGIAAWNKAGIPVAQILLGLPAYGYVSKSNATSLSEIAILPADTASAAQWPVAGPKGQHEKHVGPNQGKADASGDLSSFQGQQIPFSNIVSLGALKYDSDSGDYVGANGNEKNWDKCSDTPFLRNTDLTQLTTYDDIKSTSDKAAYAYQTGLGGVSFWDISGEDRSNSSNAWPLTTAARKAFGYSS